MKKGSYLTIALTIFTAASTAIADTAELSFPYGLALNKSGNLVVSCQGKQKSVVIMSRKGEKLAEFGSQYLERPAGLAIDAQGRFLVTNVKGHREQQTGELVIFDADGKMVKTIGGMLDPRTVLVGPNGRIYICDAGNSRVIVFDKNAEKQLFVIDKIPTDDVLASPLKHPAGIAIGDGKLYISDTGNGRILIMPLPTKPGELADPVIIQENHMRPEGLALGNNGELYVINHRRIRCFSLTDYKETNSFAGRTTMWFNPREMVIDSNGRILATDWTSGRVIATNADMVDATPTLALDEKDRSKATIEWTSLDLKPTMLRYGTDEDCKEVYEDKTPTTKHRVVLKDLELATRYYYHIGSPIESIPEIIPHRKNLPLGHQRRNWKVMAKGYSSEYAFATLPEPGKVDWVTAPSLIVVYKNTISEDRKGNKLPNRVLTDEDIAVLKSEFEKYRLWVWRHTSCKVNLEWTYVIVEEECLAPGMLTEEVVQRFAEGVEAQGKDLHDFWFVDVCGTAGWYAFYLGHEIGNTGYELGSCFTGFGPGTRPGWWWFPCHEHGHLMHSWIMNSGIGTFCFPDAPWTFSARCGENFHFLSTNYRIQPVRSWLTLKKSIINQSTDANGNGVPDDDPRVPLDEKRFGWTKEMGGDCLKRLMAGGRTPGYPQGTYKDFEGKVHKLNEGELNWVDKKIVKTKKTPKIDGKFDEGEWKEEVYSMPNIPTPKAFRDMKAKLYISWDKDNYYFAIKSSIKVIAGFDLDAANDGWFHGRDNLRFSVRPPMGKRGLEVGGQIWDFLNDQMNLHNGQHWYKDAYKAGDIKGAAGKTDDGWYILECAVPARPGIRIKPGPNEKFALRCYLWSEEEGAPKGHANFFDAENFIYDMKCVEK